MIQRSVDNIVEVNTFNILGIDPGTDTIGFSVITIDIDSLEVVSVKAWTVKASKLLDEQSLEVQIHSTRFSRLKIISNIFEDILYSFTPTIVVSEAPFFNRLRPSAYAPLVETVFILQKTLNNWDDYKPLYMCDPPTVKKAIGASARADKHAVKVAIKTLEELKVIDFETLDEHSVDATAVAYCWLLKIRGQK